MATTETLDQAQEVSYLRAKKGIMSWLVTIDHKRIGVMYLVSVLATFTLGGLLALLVRAELWAPNVTNEAGEMVGQLFGADVYNRLFTLHGLVMVFLFIIPSVPAAFGNFVLPLMLGAKDVAFPRLNLASYYVYAIGTAMALYATIAGGVDTGWTFYTPLQRQRQRAGGDDGHGRVRARLLEHLHGAQLHRDHPQDAGAGYDLAAPAALLVGDLCHLDHPGDGDPGARHHPLPARDGAGDGCGHLRPGPRR